MNYKILKKESLFLLRNLKDVCKRWELTNFPGVVLAQDEKENYIVFAATKCDPITKYNAGDIIKPSISENIFETFENYEDALRMYEYLANIASKIPLFHPSEKVMSVVMAEQHVKNTSKVIYNHLIDFMDGVSLVCYISIGKDDYYYHIFLNNCVTFSFDNEESFKKILIELKTYVSELPVFNITKQNLPSWFSLSNKIRLQNI